MPQSGTTSYIVRLGDLSALRAHVEAVAQEDEVSAERLLGQLAHLEASNAGRDPHDRVDFRPPPGCEDITQRSIERLHAAPFGLRGRGRFRRAS